MDLDKLYTDIDGNKKNILQMVRDEPEWAANRIQIGESAIAAIDDYKNEQKKIYDKVMAYFPLNVTFVDIFQAIDVIAKHKEYERLYENKLKNSTIFNSGQID